jgi:hypothetical protein
MPKVEINWSKVGIGAAAVASLALLIEHVIPHAIDLNPVHHWLSEYVLSGSVAARIIMRVAFFALAICAFSVAMLARPRISKSLFTLSSLGLAAMPFLDTDPNDGRSYHFSWPLTAGNLHQLSLYVAIGATLFGIGLSVYRQHRRKRGELLLLGVAVLATIVQAILIATSHAAGEMTRFGGITERIIVGAMLAWVVLFATHNYDR